MQTRRMLAGLGLPHSAPALAESRWVGVVRLLAAKSMGGLHVSSAASIKAESICMTIVFLLTTSRHMGR